ncbi:MAG TPA: SUF system NifU family Fe-S cluster assembly protein [Dehalococcoidia bacterium]|nr:SUF system NifU family Fe-S cluster assembly protein [Dehalococcoidia bacterium]
MTVPEPQFDELYREVILDHYRRPRNRGKLTDATAHADGANPVCGDEISLDVRLDDGRIESLAFEGVGCSISQASASLMTDRVSSTPIEEAQAVRAAFRKMLLENGTPDPSIGDLEVLEGVKKFPVRVKCALLAWNVLDRALEAQPDHKSGDDQ